MQKTPWSLIAKRMASIGLLPIPTKKNKESLIKWSTVSLASLDQNYYSAFDSDKCGGIAIVAGPKSGGLECLDVDSANDLDGTMFESLTNAIIDHSPALYERLTIASTPSGGYHILYRTKVNRRNVKLARRMSTDQELEEAKSERKASGRDYENMAPFPIVLIETRGDGGYFLGWPSPGYNFIKGNYGTIMEITDEDAEVLFDISKQFDQLPADTNARSSQASKPSSIPGKSPQSGINLGQEPSSVPDKVQKSASKKYLVTPWDDYIQKADVVTYLEEAGWRIVRTIPSPDDGRLVVYLKRPGVSDKDVSATFNHVPGKVFCFSTSTRLPDNKPLNAFDVFLYDKHSGNIKLAVEDLERMGYGVRRTPSNEQSKEIPLPTSKESKAISIAMKRSSEMVRGDHLETWWTVTLTEKRNGEISKSIVIHQYKFVKWLESKGLRCRVEGESVFLILVEGMTCRDTTKKEVADLVNDYISSLPNRFDFIDREDLREHFMKGVHVYLSDIRISMVKSFDKEDLIRDDKEASYIPFENGVLKVSKHGESIIPYKLFHKLVWRDAIKKHKYESPESDEDRHNTISRHPFNIFLYNISGRDQERLDNLKQLLGYCLVTYKDPSIPAAVILCDSKVSERSEGGTGKGILVKALSQIRSTVYEDGKIANKKNQSEFRFSRVTDSTEILHLADVEKGFDFEAMFSLLTEGMPINRKFRAEEFIPYERSPKLVISTNYTVSGRGSSHDRRRVEFELADHYNARRTPFSDFGHHFFDGWNEQQWNGFYVIMAQCIKMYLQNGMPKFVGINIDLRKFKDETSSDFLAWFTTKFGSRDEVMQYGPRTSGRFHFGMLYSEYLGFSGLERSETRPNRFKNFMACGCSFVGLEMQEISEKRAQSSEYERYLHIAIPGNGPTEHTDAKLTKPTVVQIGMNIGDHIPSTENQ